MEDSKVRSSLHQHSQSQIILWLLEELGIDYNINLFERQTSGANKHRAPVSLKETHQLGKSPQLITPEGRVIIERAAIAKYLIEKYDTEGKFKLNPQDRENDDIREEELMSFGSASLYPMLSIKMIFEFLQDGSPFFVRPLVGVMAAALNKGFLNKEMSAMLKYLDQGLEGKEFFLATKNPTRVDICTVWYVDMASFLGEGDLSSYPNLKRWYDGCKGREAWKRALDKGNGYDLGKLKG